MRKRKAAAALLAGGLLLAAGLGAWQIFGDGGGREMRVTNYHNELFGENVYIFSPEDDPGDVNAVLAEIYAAQEESQFGEERCAMYFMPGDYDDSIEVNVGFYTQVAGLSELPTDTRLASLNCLARWLGDDAANHNACCNFWRGVENLTVKSNTVWAVSQATFMRRVQIDGALYLHDDYGWCSGGFLADAKVERMVDSGSQQQWLSRNCDWKAWMGANWNMVFLGIPEGKSPEGTWPAVPYTDAGVTERIQEKPFLIYDEKEGYQVFVPSARTEASGISWEDGAKGEKLPISDFYVAKADEDTAESLNAALSDGKHLLLTPGIYELDEPLLVENADTIVLGMGLATLRPVNGNACIKTADAPGLILAGILFDAGEKESDSLLVVGAPEKIGAGTEATPGQTDAGAGTEVTPEQNGAGIALSDLFFRVGGTQTVDAAKVKNCAVINSDHVTGDNFWVWRADHGDGVAWDANTAENGIIVNGNDVSMYALMVEHFQGYQTIWNGNDGKIIMYQCEIPYDVPSQNVWMSHDGAVDGYASIYVDPEVQAFEAMGLGVYLYNRDAAVNLHTVVELPDQKGVSVRNICTVMLTGYPGMEHIVNDSGEAVMRAGERKMIISYENGLIK